MNDLLTELKTVPEFKDVPESQLVWLVEKGEIRRFSDSEKVFKSGDTIEGFQIVLQGKVDLYFTQNGNRRNLGAYEKGEILGRLPYSRMKQAAGEGFAIGSVSLFFLHRDHFPEMIGQCHDITEALVHNMTDRVRDFTKQQQQNDKMMALGKLSAGLAHELNNPSAAVVRSAQELKKHLSNVPENFKRVIKIKATDEIVDKVNNLVFDKISSYGNSSLTLMQRSDLEDQLGDWLEANEISNGYEMTETFAEFGMHVEDFDTLKIWLRPEDKLPVIGWLNQILTTEKLVREIEEASKRINALVSSVKGYTHMDQAPEKEVTDIHIGIRNTLTMLNHKIKKNNIKLIESFDANLPKARIFVSEMNQVWTNIIDNAIDAMEGRPNNELEIKTQKDQDFIVVSIIDNGPGIPHDILDKIFDPFFTTKSIGKGTGLGLEVVQRIISQHNGKVYVNPLSGKTEFKICFPYN
jgi:signal transduction histidine kinase